MTTRNASPADASPSPKPARLALTLVFLIMLLDVMGLTILFPVGAFLVRRYSQDALMVALLTGIYAGAQLLAAPALGKLSDRYGRRPVLLVSLLGSAAGYVLFGVGGALWVLFLSRAIDGVTGGNMSTATAYIADVSRPEERAKNFGLAGMAWGLGLVLGPALGAVAGQVGLELPAFVAAALTLAAAAVSWFLLPESLPKERRDPGPLRAADLDPLASILRFLRKPGFLAPLAALSLFQLAFQGVNSTEALYAIQRFAAQPWQLGLLLLLVGVTVATVQGAGVRWALPRLGERRTAVAALSLLGLLALACFAAPVLSLFFAAVVLRSGASGFVFPSLGGLVSRQASPREQGELMGVTTGLGSLMSALGPVAAGAAHEHLLAGAGYLLCAMLVGLAALLALRVTSPAPTPAPAAAPTPAEG
jgi:multidrug resistance protein